MDPSGSGNQLKRQRTPLSDSEDNTFSPPDCSDGQKRQRLDRAGQENLSPATSSGRSAELALKPDTPAINSVRSRVQQLTQRQGAGPVPTQRCLSDPGTDNLSIILHNKAFTEHLLGENEFNQRLERFKAPVFEASPSQAPPSPRPCSDLVSGIQQKLKGSLTPSSKQAAFIRQEREKELRLLHAQPISENAWLKRSSSDPTISEQGDGDANSADGSFTETLASKAEQQKGKITGERMASDALTAACSQVGLQDHAEHEHAEKETRRERPEGQGDHKIQGSRSQLRKCSELFIEEEEKENVLDSPPGREISREKQESAVMTEDGDVEALGFEGGDGGGGGGGERSGDEEMELSTDEETRLWRYPQERGEPEGEGSPAGEEEEQQQEKSPDPGAQPGVQDEDDRRIVVLASPAPETLRPEDAIREDVQMESVVHPLAESPKTETNGEPFHGDPEACGKDPLQTVDQEAISENVEREEQHPEYKLPESCGGATDHQAAVDDRPALNGDSAAMAPTDQDRPPDSKPNVAAETPSEENQVRVLGLLDVAMTGPAEQQNREAQPGPEKRVTFTLEPELISDSILSESDTSCGSTAESSFSGELSSLDETNTAEMIDQMFDEVLEYAGRMEEHERRDEENMEEHDSGIGTCTGDKGKTETGSEKERSEGEEEQLGEEQLKAVEKEVEKEKEEEEEEGASKEMFDISEDDLLTFPPSGILSPLSKSVEAVVTPLRLAVHRMSNPPSVLLAPEEEVPTSPGAEPAPMYSIDAYRNQRQSNLPAMQSVTPTVQRRAPEISRPAPSMNAKEKIAALSEEAAKLQSIIAQTLQALGCCVDETHGRGSLEEAEAEKLLLVSCEKRTALLAEVTRLRGSASEEPLGADEDYISQQPCRGTVSIRNVQLPLKVEFVCSSRNRTGRPSHYFFLLIRYGPCNIVATRLATAADAKNGDTISFPTSVTLKDIRSNFEIEVEVYSLSHTSGSTSTTERLPTKPRVTPRKLLSTITHRSNNSLTASTLPALNPRRSSNFCLVGSHKITLSSLGQTKFPLDKMKFDGKIRRLLGDEFQEKVPFLSPLEGNVYLRMESEGHSNVQHQGFLTMFEVINGFGAWHRRFFTLQGSHLYYWNHPNDRETKAAEGIISLASSPTQCVKPVKRDSCARPFTFELVSNMHTELKIESQEAVAKRWFSSDTKQERLDWMRKLNQVLLDLHTWTPSRAPGQPSEACSSSSSSLRESLL